MTSPVASLTSAVPGTLRTVMSILLHFIDTFARRVDGFDMSESLSIPFVVEVKQGALYDLCRLGLAQYAASMPGTREIPMRGTGSGPMAGAPRKRKTNRREVARSFRVGSGSGHTRHLRQVSTKLCLDKSVSEVYISK